MSPSEPVLEAQQQLYPAENSLSRIEAARRLTVVQLYKALGGGWEKEVLPAFTPAPGERSEAREEERPEADSKES